MQNASLPLLVTIAPSHYCEKARWALDRLGIAYIEEAHAPMLHWLATYTRGGRRTVPVLIHGDKTLRDSTDILQHLDGTAPEALRLYPEAQQTRQAVLHWEDYFDETLGPAVRRWGNAWLLDHPRMYFDLMNQRMPATEESAFRVLLPGVIKVLRRAFKISPAAAERSLDRIREVFAKTDAMLADGRPYLVSDRFTAADLTLASLSAFILLPEEYGVLLPRPSDLPADVASTVHAFRETPTGRFVRNMYLEHRRS
jgi:glutathione S-transferase